MNEQNINNTEVNLDFNENFSFAEKEDKYKETEKEVVTKTYVREIIRKKSNNIVSELRNGNTNKIILVTGDRGTGITTSALSIANYFAQHSVKVLYFDCDIENNGIWTYINYDKYMGGATQKQQNGVKECKFKKNLDECVIHINEYFDILSSDYSSSVSAADINDAQGVVAEIIDKYGVIVVDCPISKLYMCSDLVLLSTIIMCVEFSKRGYMNFYCRGEASILANRYKNALIKKGTIALTRGDYDKTAEDLHNYYKNLIDTDGGIDWFSMPVIKLNLDGLSEAMLNNILARGE